MRIAFFGGVYNNYLALQAAIEDARRRDTQGMYCLGDLGAFGPYPDRVCEMIREHEIDCVQGNYDHSIGNDLQDCQCGYTDPRDNYFAQISYEYTYENTNDDHKRWMRKLDKEIRFERYGARFLLCHGSPRKTNEFLWESTTSTHFLNKLAEDFQADLILGTHTGVHWHRELQGGRRFVNVGVLGRPENDGRSNVWYAIVDVKEAIGGAAATPLFQVEFVPVQYDYQRLAGEMRAEKLPEEFVQTTLTGWWTTCLEVLPAKERRRGKY